MADYAALDNAIWNALATAHAPLARVSGIARRYASDVSPLSGLREASPAAFADLAALVPPEQKAAFFTIAPVKPPPDWQVV